MGKIAAMKRGMENRITQAGRARETEKAADLILEHSLGIPKGAGRVSLPDGTAKVMKDRHRA